MEDGPEGLSFMYVTDFLSLSGKKWTEDWLFCNNFPQSAQVLSG